MGVGLKQSLNLAQTLRMTPQLQQAIRLLARAGDASVKDQVEL